jgi:hypothetical protein
MTEQQKVQNLNNAQREYSKNKKEAQALLNKINRALLDTPAACNGDWALVGDMAHLVSELKNISDRLNGEGEYAD